MSNEIKLVNKRSEYPLVFKFNADNTLTLPPCLSIAEVYDLSYQAVGKCRVLDDSGKINILNQKKVIKLVKDLPEPQKDVLYVVSDDVFELLSNIRKDLITIDEEDDIVNYPEFRGQNLFVFDKSL